MDIILDLSTAIQPDNQMDWLWWTDGQTEGQMQAMTILGDQNWSRVKMDEQILIKFTW